ncbi:hypothetical protein [Actinoplanes sp. GCM10030250]|uniref:hypothetical protein n=1 Tax=Actinoplanes sp. GCM10030250 TaxID=3273376 RepID=UPI00361B0A1C
MRRVVGVVVALGVLVVFAGYALVDSAYLMSNGCIGDTGQTVCPSSGPDWARPVPGWAIGLGLLAGLAGAVAGRRARTPSLIAGFLLVTLGLIGSRLMA